MKVYLHIYNGNVQQNPLCAASCITKDLPISPRFSPTIFYRDANSVLLQAHLCTVVGSMRRTLCSKLFIRRALRSIYTCSTGMFSRRTLVRSILCHKGYSHLSPVLAYDFLSPGKFSTLQCTVRSVQQYILHRCSNGIIKTQQ